MELHPFSPDAREFAELEMRLDEGDLTLGEIRGIEDQMILKPTDDKTKKFVQGVFARIGDKRKTLVDREIVKLDGRSDLASKIERLSLLNREGSQEGTEIETLALYRELPLEEDARAQKSALSALEDIRFSAEQPLAHDFDDQALQSNFVSRIRLIGKTMVEQNSLIPFKEGLNRTQQLEVQRYAGG